MNHLGAEVSELHGLAVRHLVDDLGFRDLPRIATHDAVDVGPDMHFVGIEQRAEDGRGIVAAVAPQRGRQAVLVRRDEPRDNGDSRESRRNRRCELLP
jgi:hypothetical protein